MAKPLHITDDLIANRIDNAVGRVVLVTPGFFPIVAAAIVRAISRLKAGRVTVISDIDPEACRLGYGDFQCLERVQVALQEAGTLLCHEPGLRIGLLVADNTTLVFSPSARLVEEDVTEAFRTNGFELGEPPPEIAAAVGLDSIETRSVGLDQVPTEKLTSVKEELRKNPPIPFDLSRVVRVFNSQLEFVSFSVDKVQLQRVEIEIPPELTGFTSTNLRTLFTFDPGKELLDLKQALQDDVTSVQQKFTRPAKGFGESLIRRTDKPEFEKEVTRIGEHLGGFKLAVKARIAEVIKRNVEQLADLYASKLSGHMQLEDLRALLNKAFQTKLNHVVASMRIRLLYKGITYESLKDEAFIAVAKKAFPDLLISEEFDAARQR
jgi:hypothetical protein